MQYVETQTGMIIQTRRPELWTTHHLDGRPCGKHLPKAEGERRLKEQAKKSLLGILEKGDTVFCILRSVNRSGDFRAIDFYAVKDGRPIWLTGYMAALLGRTISKKGGLQVRGGGMDMGFSEVYNLAATLWADRDDRDGGYLLRSEWL